MKTEQSISATITNEYAIAMEKSSKAIRTFNLAQVAYRARTIGDLEFLTARAEYDKAMAEYDKTYNQESNRVITDNSQQFLDDDCNLPFTY